MMGWEPWLRGDSVMKIGDRCQRRVREFMEAVGLHTSRTVNWAMNYNLLRELVREEAAEFNEAMMALESAVQDGGSMEAIKEAQVEVIDAICDTIVVLHNTTNAMGIDLAPFFDEVHRSNMAKVGGPVREDGKRLKPEGWKPPALRPILDEQYRR